MNSKNRNYHWVEKSLLLVLFSLLLMGMMIPSRVITVHYAEQQCKLSGDQFSLSWIHSVDKTPWIEHYQLTSSGLLLTETLFKTFGAGVPHDGEVLPSQDGMIHYRINQPVNTINWIVDRDVRSSIIHKTGENFPIYQYVDRYTAVEIQPQKINLWQLLSIRKCHEP